MLINDFHIANEHYPLVVRQSRYGGVYEGGEFFCYSGSTGLSEAYFAYLDGDDCDAVDFWNGEEATTFGVGSTPNDALSDFCKKNAIPSDGPEEYKPIVSNFESQMLMRRYSTESIERTDYYQMSHPIFSPRKDTEF